MEESERTITQAPLFYRGDLDHKVVAVESGARVNSDYAAFVKEGPFAEVKTHEVGDRIHTITGYGISNYTFIEGDTGLILVDTGMSVGAGREVLRMKAAFSDKPVVAVIYSHHHYTGGTRGVLESYPGAEIPIYAHPDIDRLRAEALSYMASGTLRRGAIQFGRFLPAKGADAGYGIEEPHFDDPALDAMGHVPVTHPVADGQEFTIDGIRIIFHHAIADTEDSLIIHLPDLDAVVHNTAVMPFMFPMYTLRGELYRAPLDAIESVDKLRALKPKHLIGCHGIPVTGREQAYALATVHRDALAFVFQQTVRGINQGLSPDEIVARTDLPSYFEQVPELFTAYVDVEHMVRGVYRGLLGWWSGDGADLHPPTNEELGAEVVRAFGGVDALLARTDQLMAEGRYNLAAKMAGFAVASEPENASAAKAKATALRKMAYATPTGIQTRNFLLTEALQLEGLVIDESIQLAPNVLPVELIAALPPAMFVQSLAYAMDARPVEDLVITVRLEFTNAGQAFTLAIRHGAVDIVPSEPEAHDLELTLDTESWARLAVGERRLGQLIDEGKAKLSGDEHLRTSFLAAYADVL